MEKFKVVSKKGNTFLNQNGTFTQGWPEIFNSKNEAQEKIDKVISEFPNRKPLFEDCKIIPA